MDQPSKPDETFVPARTRREFCTHSLASAAAFAAVLGPLLEGCSGSPTSPSNASSLPVLTGTQSGTTLSLTIDASSPLNGVGALALVQSSSRLYLVARTGASTFNALTSTCTHQTCTISGYSGSTFVCPCHGSTFDTSGRVLGGPAPRSLTQYPTSFANNVLTITG